MISDDYFKKQVDQLGKALGKVLADLLQLPTGKTDLVFENVNESLAGQVDVDLDKILQIPDEELVSVLWHNYHFRTQNLEDFAAILHALGRRVYGGENAVKSQENLFRKALVIYQYLQENSPVFSMGRQQKITELQQALT